WKTVLAALGPGVIVLGGSIGTGEWLMGPAVTVRFQGQLLWIATLAILLQSVLNCEVIRYALATGEPVFTGYLRTKPGPRFWSIVYLMCDFGMFFPAFAGALAQLLVAAYLGEGKAVTPAHNPPIMIVGVSVVLISFTLTLFGGKIYNTMLACMTFKVIWVLAFLLFVDIFLVGRENWVRLFQGFFFPFNASGLMLPKNLRLDDWATIAGFAAFAGAGGLSNATFSNYAREKGWGMGAHVGCIPSAVGGAQMELSPLGTVFHPTEEVMSRWHRWWKHIHFDQYAVWVVGCFAGVMLPAAMSLGVLEPSADGKINQMQIASMQAQGIADTIGGIWPGLRMAFWYLTLFTGFLIIWFTLLQALDHTTRRWTDILWTSSSKARDACGGAGVKRIYYGIAFSYALINCAVLIGNTVVGATPFTIVLLTAVSQGFATGVTAVHTLYVNRRFLPKPLRPPVWREVGLVLCAIFYVTMTSLAVYPKVRGLFVKESAAAVAPAPPRTAQAAGVVVPGSR
ncbi:MAG TPA: Nramp family divalent metal transporter, partial [Armatimonadota bacterium]|nr:Nramp family divalent metal transporter [Armatimonadota bacterium]